MAVWLVTVYGLAIAARLVRDTGSVTFEWAAVPMKTYIERLKAAIEADATLAAYAPNVAVITERQLDRYDVAALATSGYAIVLHNPFEESNHVEHMEVGRDCDKLSVTISVVRRGGATLNADFTEAGLMGDAISGRKGVLEVQADLYALLWDNGLLNRLPDGGGVPYVWDLEIGAVEEAVVETEKSVFLTASRTVTGHRWRQYV